MTKSKRVNLVILCGCLLCVMVCLTSCRGDTENDIVTGQSEQTEQSSDTNTVTEKQFVTQSTDGTSSETSIQSNTDENSDIRTETEQTTETVSEVTATQSAENSESNADTTSDVKGMTEEDVLNISDERLAKIAFGDYSTKDFIPDLYDISIESFGGALDSEEGICIKTIKENESDYKKYTEDFFDMLEKSNTTYDGETGQILTLEQKDFCGENDLFLEYKVTEKRVRTMYIDNELKTSEIVHKYRYFFLKPLADIDINKENITDYYDLMLVYYGAGVMLYRDVDETETSFIYTYYEVFPCYGDYGVNNVATLLSSKVYVIKATNEAIYFPDDTIKEYEVPNSAPDYPMS